jgi:tetratricopeptide (TPR) repeat protein
LADFGRAIRLAPGDTFALMARGDICFDRGDRKSAEKDYAEALRVAPDPRSVLERLSAAHERAGLFEETVRDDDTLIVGTPDADRRAALLNARCWVRAEWGQELEPH